jgi:hypothetical protein
VADAFVTARLLTTNESAGTTTIEVSHEALIRAWPRLSQWVAEGREDIQVQQAVSQDVEEWERHGKPKDRLYRGSQLKEATLWARRNVPSGSEMTFLRASASHLKRSRVSIAALALVLMLVIGIATQVVQTIQTSNLTRITSLADAGTGSLRQVINTAPAGSSISVSPDVQGTIELTSGNIDIGKSLTIVGPGARELAVSSGVRGFFVHVAPGVSVTISDLAFTHSIITREPAGPLSFITNEGKLTLVNCLLSNNTAQGPAGVGHAGQGGAIYNKGLLNLQNSVVSDNTARGTDHSTSDNYGGSGGGIMNAGTLNLTHSLVSRNIAAAAIGGKGGSFSGGGGGGILNSKTGTLNLTDSVVSDNIAAGGIGPNAGGGGGGILNNGTLNLTMSTIRANKATGGTGPYAGGFGGGISNGGYNNVNPITLEGSTISGNIAGAGSGPFSGGYGGGIYTNMSPLTAIDSTISHNKALGGSVDDSDMQHGIDGSGGGGIYNSGADNTLDPNHIKYTYGALTLVNSTISDNTTDSTGGGIGNWGGQISMTFCTIYGNSAGNGGGIATKDGYYALDPSVHNPVYQSIASHMQMQASLIAGNHASVSADLVGTVISNGYNLVQDVSGTVFDPPQRPSSDVLVDASTNLGIDPQLAGPSPQTHALLQGSPAIDVIPLDACTVTVAGITLTTDQRGIKRPQAAKCDIGAYEYAVPAA